MIKTKMKYTIYQKIGFAALGLVAITLFTILLSKKATELRKKRQAMVEGMESAEDFFNDIGNGIKEIPNKFTDGMNSLGNLLLGPIMSIVNFIEGVINGIPNLGKGIYNHAKCGAEEVKNGADYGLDIFGIILACAWDKNKKFWDGTCTRYYFIDMIFGIFYGVCIELPLLIIYTITGLDFQFLVDMVLEVIILPLDSMIYIVSGYHITQWPDSVIKNCYSCAGTMDIGDGNGRQTLHKSMGEWGSMLNCTTHQFMHGISKIFYSILPGPKYGIWWSGAHLDGGDDYPTYL